MTTDNAQGISTNSKRFADFNSTLEIYSHVFKSANSLRHYVFFAKSNGLEKVISRLGKKLVFNLDKLDMWLENGGAADEK